MAWERRAAWAAACRLVLLRGACLRRLLGSLRLARSRTVVWPSTNVQCLRRSLCAADNTPCSDHAPVVCDQIRLHCISSSRTRLISCLTFKRLGLSYAGTH